MRLQLGGMLVILRKAGGGLLQEKWFRQHVVVRHAAVQEIALHWFLHKQLTTCREIACF